jgi:hypothetical protein
MKVFKRSALVSFGILSCLATTAFAGHAVSPARVTLVVPDTKVLPGVPFEMWVDIQNPADGEVGVGLCPTLIVRTDQGEAFEVKSRGASGWLLPTPGADPYLLLAPGQTKTLPFPIQHGLQAEFFEDYRLSPPGRYTLAVRLDFCWGHASPQASILPATFFGPAVTNEVTVERIQPSGSDALVWKQMLDSSDGRWTPTTAWRFKSQRQVWIDVLAKYPDSHYVPYALLENWFGNVDAAYLLRILDAIGRFPDSPVLELLHIQACGRAQGSPPLYDQEFAYLQHSKRPTTRILMFPNENKPPQPCPPEYDCEP